MVMLKERDQMKTRIAILAIILLALALTVSVQGCSDSDSNTTGSGGSNDKHANCSFHKTHWHYSAINHTHTASYNTACGPSHGHCH